MKKLQTLVLALALVALASVSWAATHPNSSRRPQKGQPPLETDSINLNSSRTNFYGVVAKKSVVSSEQATLILRKLDQFKGAKVDDAKVREILESCGVRADMNEILYLPKTETRKVATYILLTNPKNKSAAIASPIKEQSEQNRLPMGAENVKANYISGKVTQVNKENKTFTVEVTFSAKAIPLPKKEDRVDVIYTPNPTGGPPEATTVRGSKSNSSERVVPGQSSAVTGKVLQVDAKKKTFTVEVTFSAKNLNAPLPEVGKIYDITFTGSTTPGGPLEATTVKGSKSNASSF